MEHDKFMQYGRGLGLWRNPRENIKPDPINYFRDDPIYLTPSKGEWINQIQECKKENNPLENGLYLSGPKLRGQVTPLFPFTRVIVLLFSLMVDSVDGLVLAGLSVMAS
ncbi:hypothetical protein [Pectobacterium brasiliense]|uniref:hypothetical protein n=1 Tax=Pectobacterium brasiliense TaxID=180957 RepID=UPI001F083935|nr:hypothetical protein [Pectobacterium brasiliense]